MIAISDNYNNNRRDNVCPCCGYVIHNSSITSHNDSYAPSYIEPEPDEPEIIQHIHPKLWQKKIGNLLRCYLQPLYNSRLLFCISGHLPKRIKRIRKNK